MRFSSCDWPGKLAAVVFISGCPWRCRYCHNPHLQTRSKEPGSPSWEEVVAWLESRKGLLDGLVFCGGEPLAEPQLPAMMQQVNAMGFGVALHTGGGYPNRLRECLPWVDWVGFDVKAPFPEYLRVTCAKGSGEAAIQSLQQVIDSGVDFECRTTVHPDLLSDADLLEIGRILAAAGIHHYALQKFRPHGCDDAQLLAQGISSDYPAEKTLETLRQAFEHFTLRAA
ncbi:anaerobic ribonucleoside-triphosphate reductase activating protein [Formivibrio citricus]|uniref:anaerobic ribonucleoside-triphosphate reductase activating protein n=1 Tax=Formivibrio citricus TaxID=83765 RepID=UPI001FE20881|nr:anaerobic ribonucleoside-triphosphate reductase activating protein [Formivibrio citricus]